jgi:hypothetical protein
MTHRPLKKETISRLRNIYKKEKEKTGRTYPKRALKLFGKLKNADKRKYREWRHIPPKELEEFIRDVGKKSKNPGYAVRTTRIEGEEIIVKFPTTAYAHLKITPTQEIRFVRRLVGEINKSLKGKGVRIIKPIGYAVGPFIVSRKSKYPEIEDVLSERPSPLTRRRLEVIAKYRKITVEQVQKEIRESLRQITETLIKSNNIPINNEYSSKDLFLENNKGHGWSLRPLKRDHLQFVDYIKGEYVFVPYIDAI